MTLMYRFRRALARRFFSAGFRLKFYRLLALQMRNKILLLQALEQIRDMYTDFGRKSHGFGLLVDDCQAALKDNSEANSLAHVLSRWVPAEEAALISAGMRSNKLPEALEQAEVLIACRKRITMAVLKMAVYPLGCAVMLTSTLVIINEQLIPTMSEMADPASWTGMLGLMNTVLTWVKSHGVLWGGVLGLGVVWTLWSLPRWVRPDVLRRQADKWVPWGVYSDIQGAIFLINIGALLQAEVKTLDALLLIRRFASPWLAVRLDAMMEEVADGASLGIALRACGYNFPSKEAVNYLSMVTGDNSASMIAQFGQEWLNEAVGRVNRRALGVMVVGMLMLLSLIGGVAMAIYEVSRMTGSLGQ